MNLSTVQTVFLLYSSLSFLSAILIGALFWNRRDYSASLWLWGCLLTSIATAVTVFRGEIPLTISYSLMVSLEVLSILLFSESLKQLSKTTSKTKFNKLILIIPAALFTLIEIEGSTRGGIVTPLISATTTLFFAVANVFCLYQAIHIGRKFTNRFFFRFLAVAFGIMSCLYLFRIISVAVGYGGYTFDTKILNIITWFFLALFGSIRNLAYIVLRLHLGFSERTYLNTMNLKLSSDLEERNNLILSLERLNKSASINALASTIAHEINQPLGACKLNAQFIQMKLDSDPGNTSLLKEVINNILSDIERTATIIKNLASFKHSTGTAVSTINLLDSINEVAEISKSKLRNLKINLDIDCPPDLLIKINLGEWQQVLINLFNNAIEAIDQLGAKERKINISASGHGGNIEITIQDGGPGIPAGQESKIFDLMVTNKESGSGIGLWLTKNIINRNGGDIAASNKVGGGACFTIKLPNI